MPKQLLESVHSDRFCRVQNLPTSSVELIWPITELYFRQILSTDFMNRFYQDVNTGPYTRPLLNFWYYATHGLGGANPAVNTPRPSRGTRIESCENTRTHTHTHPHSRIGEGGRGTKKRKKPKKSCRRRAGNGGDMCGKRNKCRKERVGSVAANSDNPGSNKEAVGGAQGAQGSSKICTSRESVSPLSRLIRGFRNKYH